jgi:hypothetical protein
MIGLLFLGLVGLWIWAVLKLSRWIGARVAGGRWRRPVAVVSLIALMVMPVADEIVGGFQFRALCDNDAKLAFYVDPASLKGKTVRAVADPLNQQVEGLLVKVLRSHSRYYDASDGKELLSYTRYDASGGLLIRTLTTDASIAPLTFKSSCSPLPQTDFGFKFANDRK